MRRITLAPVLLAVVLAVTGWATPSRAQWWAGGGPASGFCRPWACPGGGWARPGRVLLVPAGRPWAGRPWAGRPWAAQAWAGQAWAGPGGFEGPGWGWRRWAWQRAYWQRWAVQREARLRRIENWRRWVEAARQDEGRRTARVDGPAPRFTGWDRPVRAPQGAAPALARAGLRGDEPRRTAVAALRPMMRPMIHPPVEERRAAAPAEAAVALMPALPRPRLRPPGLPTVHAALPARILAAAAMIRHPAPRRDPAASPAPAVLRGPEPPARPTNAALLRPHPAAALRRAAASGRGDARPAAVRPVVLRSQPAPLAPALTAPAEPAEPATRAAPAAAPDASPAAPADVPVAPLD